AMFLDAIPEHAATEWFRRNGAKFQEVVRLHGRTAEQHHERLVRRFIERPAAGLPSERLQSITSSGPPLDVLLRSLETLKDLRIAAVRDDIPSRYREFARLREALGESADLSEAASA
ncbi:MAG TPA: monodechloroaminopyrrolnitrin synthase PrnB family protein, partial [Woeseiaceae bacterium]|nr:monodechloroaminopyrrolnitrin synthase PrnB family protein [Woeseiaceae bacterium]